MNRYIDLTMAMLAGAALGATAIQGLHAQAQTKPKAYVIADVELTGQFPPDYLSTVRKAIEAAHGRSLRTLNGRVIPIEGAPPPKNVALIEWDSAEDAMAFYKSSAWTDGAPARAGAERTIRRYIVEAEK
jgi:uncharacterized protein (DUF1330 family)